MFVFNFKNKVPQVKVYSQSKKKSHYFPILMVEQGPLTFPRGFALGFMQSRTSLTLVIRPAGHVLIVPDM